MADTIQCELSAFSDLGHDVLRRGCAVRFQANGRSMSPLIRDGDVLQVAPLDVEDLAVGDIIACRTERGGFFVHRLIRVVPADHGDRLLVTRGDAARREDSPCRRDQVLGRVLSISRKRGKTICLEQVQYRLYGSLCVRFPGLLGGLRRAAALGRRVAARP